MSIDWLDASTPSAVLPHDPAVSCNGMLIIVVGPAGAGKNSLMKHVIDNGAARQLPTATTRSMRPGEEHGREHLFVTKDEFQRMIVQDELVEYQQVHDNLYGMHRPTLEAALERGETIIADIDIRGADSARQIFSDNVVIVFVQPPSIGDLIDRMRVRGETVASIGLRLLRIGIEFDYAQRSDYVITNDDVGRASDKMLAIVGTVARGHRDAVTSDAPIPYHYTLHAQTLPIAGHEILVRKRAPEYPITACQPGEQPAAAARRALCETLKIQNPAPTDDSEYRAPAVIDYRCADGVEIVTYSYLTFLDEKIAAPEGWHWSEIGS